MTVTQDRRADALGAKLCVILGDDEVARGEVTVKDLAGHAQDTLPLEGAARAIADRVAGSKEAAGGEGQGAR